MNSNPTSPHAATATFLTSVNIKEDGGDIASLVCGVTQVTQSTLLLKKRKEMREVDDALEFMKEEFKTRIEACEERQKDFERKQIAMKDQVLKFEKFIQENDAKTKRAEKKVQSERKAKENAEDRIRKLLDTLQKNNKEKDELEKKLEKLHQYEKYLEDTVHAGEQYHEISDILNRHKTLIYNFDELKLLVDKGDASVEDMRAQLQIAFQETQNMILTKNSQIHRLQKNVEDLRADSLRLLSTKEEIDSYRKEKNRDYGQVVMSVKNIYTRCCASLSRKPKERKIDDQEIDYLNECLNDIRDRIIDLSDIVDGYKEYEIQKAIEIRELAEKTLNSPKSEKGGNLNIELLNSSSTLTHSKVNKSMGMSENGTGGSTNNSANKLSKK